MDSPSFNYKMGEWLSRQKETASQNDDFAEQLVFISNKITLKEELLPEELQLVGNLLSSITLLTLIMEKRQQEYDILVEHLLQ